MSTQTLDRPKTADPELSHGEPRYAHYVDGRKSTEAYFDGTPLTALCGFTWVPTRDPKKFPVCPECKRLYDLGPEGRAREQQQRLEQ